MPAYYPKNIAHILEIEFIDIFIKDILYSGVELNSASGRLSI